MRIEVSLVETGVEDIQIVGQCVEARHGFNALREQSGVILLKILFILGRKPPFVSLDFLVYYLLNFSHSLVLM